ncbi:hypothetical protein B0J14DRAFT_690625 [Halenospora varia]|nr:hypothetical protein B0J14DRAFT_690625 [Halenospora varia]
MASSQTLVPVAPSNDPSSYDFSAFAQVPAISESQSKGETLVHIPENDSIPSPLASNISPSQLQDIKEFLLGPNSTYTGNGKEVWESWKRAWDLWNNHYIEGRVDARFMREEYEGQQAERKESEKKNAGKRRKRWLRQLEVKKDTVPKLYDTFQGPNPPVPEPGRKWVKQRTIKVGEPTGKKVRKQKRKRTRSQKKADGENGSKKRKINLLDATPKSGRRRVSSKDAAERDVPPNSDLYEYIPDFNAAGAAAKIAITLSENDNNVEVEEEAGDEEWEDEIATRNIAVWELVDDFDNPAPKKRKTSSGKEKAPQPPLPAQAPQSCLAPAITITESDSNEEEEEWKPIVHQRDEVTGIVSSAGFVALKDVDEFKNDGINDIVNNTVWRPRRVGEKTVKADIDYPEFEDFMNESKLLVDGGVDCGQSPYPVLRSVPKYVKTRDGCVKKKKVWDGVTGTIFNMPTTPLEPEPEVDDPGLNRVAAIYGGYKSRPASTANPTIFPLDIRRAIHRDAKPTVPIVDDHYGEKELQTEWDNPAKQYRVMTNCDPWKVTDEQERRRDIPPRVWPPSKEELDFKEGEFIPVDDLNWFDNQNMDYTCDARYFVTNLTSDTLIINGQEIRKGRVAGPLPAFAVIETPGGQISFWWGVNGRNWGSNDDHIPQWHWNQLRRLKGWEFTGLEAGEVWCRIVKSRIEQEMDENLMDENDIFRNTYCDQQWATWKNTPSAEEVVIAQEAGAENAPQKIGTNYQVARQEQPAEQSVMDSSFRAFEMEEEELKYCLAEIPLLQKAAQSIQFDQMVEPAPPVFWEGPVKYTSVGTVTAEIINEKWNKEKKTWKDLIISSRATRDLLRNQILRARKRRCGDENNYPLPDPATHLPSQALQREIARQSALHMQQQLEYSTGKAEIEKRVTEELEYRAQIAALGREGLSHIEFTRRKEELDKRRKEVHVQDARRIANLSKAAQENIESELKDYQQQLDAAEKGKKRKVDEENAARIAAAEKQAGQKADAERLGNERRKSVVEALAKRQADEEKARKEKEAAVAAELLQAGSQSAKVQREEVKRKLESVLSGSKRGAFAYTKPYEIDNLVNKVLKNPELHQKVKKLVDGSHSTEYSGLDADTKARYLAFEVLVTLNSEPVVEALDESQVVEWVSFVSWRDANLLKAAGWGYNEPEGKVEQSREDILEMVEEEAVREGKSVEYYVKQAGCDTVDDFIDSLMVNPASNAPETQEARRKSQAMGPAFHMPTQLSEFLETLERKIYRLSGPAREIAETKYGAVENIALGALARYKTDSAAKGRVPPADRAKRRAEAMAAHPDYNGPANPNLPFEDYLRIMASATNPFIKDITEYPPPIPYLQEYPKPTAKEEQAHEERMEAWRKVGLLIKEGNEEKRHSNWMHIFQASNWEARTKLAEEGLKRTFTQASGRSGQSFACEF